MYLKKEKIQCIVLLILYKWLNVFNKLLILQTLSNIVLYQKIIQKIGFWHISQIPSTNFERLLCFIQNAFLLCFDLLQYSHYDHKFNLTVIKIRKADQFSKYFPSEKNCKNVFVFTIYIIRFRHLKNILCCKIVMYIFIN